MSPTPQPPSPCKAVWVFKIITHRLLSVLKKEGLFKKKKSGLSPYQLETGPGNLWGEGENRVGVGGEETDWETQMEGVGVRGQETQPPVPGGVKLLKKKKKKEVLASHCK